MFEILIELAIVTLLNIAIVIALVYLMRMMRDRK